MRNVAVALTLWVWSSTGISNSFSAKTFSLAIQFCLSERFLSISLAKQSLNSALDPLHRRLPVPQRCAPEEIGQSNKLLDQWRRQRPAITPHDRFMRYRSEFTRCIALLRFPGSPP